MRLECENLKGRLRDLCEGVGFDGRPNPTQEASDAYRAKIGLPSIVVEKPGIVIKVPFSPKPPRKRKDPPPPPKPTTSKIGTRLARIFATKVAAVPCGECKKAIGKLNNKTVEEVQATRDEIIADIVARATKSMPTWWGKVGVAADQFFADTLSLVGVEQHGVTGIMVGLYLDQACEQEAAERGKNSSV